MIKIGRYRHYKGGEYEVIGIGRHSETLEDLVVYRSLDDKQQIWVRPLAMFLDEVRTDKGDVPRFKYQDN